METEIVGVINVIICDDHVLYRTGVKAVLSSKKDIKIIAEANNGSHLLDLLMEVQPDVILLDIQMPVMDGISTLPEVKKLYPNIRIIMLTMMDDQSMITKLMDLGANCYLSKTSDSEIIYEAIKTCYEQGFYFNSSTNKPLVNLRLKISSSIKPPQEDKILSEKEINVLRLMCEEKSTREIAEAIELSLHSVDDIRDKLKTKTGVKSTAGLIMFAAKNKMLYWDT
jgi:DNA-binding NarL/FixJ family response regulator